MGCTTSKANTIVAKKGLLSSETTKGLPTGCPAKDEVQDGGRKPGNAAAAIANTDEAPSAEKNENEESAGSSAPEPEPAPGPSDPPPEMQAQGHKQPRADQCCYCWLGHGLPLRRVG
mmetsp:Transcript_139312/g.388784  ORF Transcript_139312/g.388784 Transcript_139312/m.388784 type:complete len:117 (+) Transcript_139312:97-447(+)